MLSDTWTLGFLALKLLVFLGPKVRGALRQGLNEAFAGEGLGFTSTLQNLLLCRVPIKFILGFIIRTYKKIGFGRPR